MKQTTSAYEYSNICPKCGLPKVNDGTISNALVCKCNSDTEEHSVEQRKQWRDDYCSFLMENYTTLIEYQNKLIKEILSQ